MPFLSRSAVRRMCVAALMTGVLGACATTSHDDDEYQPLPSETAPASAPAPVVADPSAVLRVSASPSATGTVPEGWVPLIIRRDKVRTDYALVTKTVSGQPRQVLHAQANAAASGLWVPTAMPAQPLPRIRWTWRADALIDGADSTRPETEDAATRVVLAFDGDMSRLPFKDQMVAETARVLLGREMPYATLIYTWDRTQPEETVIANAHSGRVKKLVVESGPARLGQWLAYERNYVQDYQQLFGEPPGRLIGVGVLTDSDNTRKTAEAWYGDILLLPPQRSAAGKADGLTAID